MAQLVFVYNAKSGKVNALLDTAHKLVQPTTYECNLCRLTHDTFAENKKWRDFKRTTSHVLEFLHKDEFEKYYASKFGYRFEFPIVLVENEGDLEVLISPKEMNGISSTENLINLLNKMLKEES